MLVHKLRDDAGITIRWFRHPEHGYMLRLKIGPGRDVVVTALCAGEAEEQERQATWEGYEARLRINAGCGAFAVDEMRCSDHNPEFLPVPVDDVPAHIRADFQAAAADWVA